MLDNNLVKAENKNMDNQPIIQTPEPCCKNDRWFKISAIIIGILIIIGLFGNIYLLLQKPKSLYPEQGRRATPTLAQTLPTPTSVVPTLTTDETANWKTYTSSKYNFQIKHPENIEIDCTGKTSSHGCAIRIVNSMGSPGFETFFLDFYTKGQFGTEDKIGAEERKKLLELKIDETKQICELPAPESCVYKRVNDFIGLVSFKVFENYKPWEGPGDILMVLINEGENKDTEVIFSYNKNVQANGSLSKELFNQILSTFRFD